MKSNWNNYVMTVDETAIASTLHLATESGELNQKWILTPEKELEHLYKA